MDDLDKISELKLLESLDLGHRKVFKEETRQKENDEFVTDINLLLSKINERINIIKKIPKLEIKYFELESSNSDRQKEKGQIPNSANLLNNQNNKLSNISNQNNLMNQTTENKTPYPIDDSTNKNVNNINNKKFVIPSYSINEKTDINQNKLNNNFENNQNIESINDEINIETDNNNKIIDKKEIPVKQNIEEESVKDDIVSIPNIDFNNDNNKEERRSLDNLNEAKDKSAGDKNSKNEIKDSRDDEANEPEMDLKKNNIGDIISNPDEHDDIPEITENINIPETNNNINTKKLSRNKETIESMNYINSNIKDEEENNQNNSIKKIEEKEEIENDDKNFKLDVEDIEIFEPDKSRENETDRFQKLKNINKNKFNEDKQMNEREEDEEKEKSEIKDNNQKQTKKSNDIEDKKESEEDQLDKEYNKIETNFEHLKSLDSHNKDEVEKNNQNPEEDNNNNINNNKEEEKEQQKENELKNKLKEPIVKKEEDEVSIESLDHKKEQPSVEIEEIDHKKEEEKKEEVLEINEDEISEQENEDKNNLKSPNKELEKTKEDKDKSLNQTKNNSKKEGNSKINNKSKQTNILNKTNTMPQKNLNTPKKFEFKKSLTQNGEIFIQIKASYLKTDKDESSFNISNIDEYPILKNLNSEEKALNDIIPDFNQLILKNEKKEYIEEKRNYLITKKQTLLNIQEGREYSQYYGVFQPTHPQLMISNYNEDTLNERLKRDSEFENKFNNLSFDEINSPIGPIENIESLTQKYLLENEDVKESFKSNFSKWRKILGDGNSLYRIIMFSLFEAYILNKKIMELKYLIFEITSDEYVDIYKEKEIDTEICFNIFAEILHLLEEENDENKMKAYEILIKAFSLKDGSFDKMLIVYLRHLLAIYTEQVKKGFIEEEKNNNDFDDSNRFNSYFIEANNLEPSFLNICCFQYLFDIKMNITYLQGEINNPENRNINLVPEEDADYPFINIGFFYSSYHKLYPHNFEVNYNCTLPIPKTINRGLTVILKDTRFCSECKKERDHILFIEKKFIICKICLEKILSKICNFRSDNFEKDGFFGVEYYTRPINLKDQYYIDDYEIIELLECNILETLIQKYGGVVCKNCHEKVDDIIVLKCGCEFCKKCLVEIILQKTNGIRYLNEFEKKEIRNTKCQCGKFFDIETGLKFISKGEKDKREALNRLKKYIQSCCLICTGELRAETKDGEIKDINENIKYKKIKMKKSNGESLEAEVYETDHLICEQCYGIYLKRKIEIDDEYEEEEEGNINDAVDFEKETILCNICCKKHLFKAAHNEACCASDCMIV